MNSSTIVFDFSANKINKKMHNSVTESTNSILTKRTNFYRIILSHTQCLFVDMAINENVW